VYIAHRLIVVGLVLAPATVLAEVMDKELSISDIWLALLSGVVVCVLAAALWRWLLVPSLYFGLTEGLAYAWTEWFSPHVGPNIAAEAGDHYGYHANAALSLLLLVHVAAWFLSTRHSVVGIRWRPARFVSTRGRVCTLVYAAWLALSVVLAVLGGFSTVHRIWLSPPVLVAGAFLSWAGFSYVRTATAQTSVV
jgi:hypothetical protein